LQGFRFIALYFYPMNRMLFILGSIIFFTGCKNKPSQEEKDASFFPVVSFIKGQVKNIDTSLYRIVKVETIDTTRSTTYIKREDFGKYAKDFLELPDISSSKWKDDYQETKVFDDALNKVILSYTTTVEDNPVRREDVMLNPTNESGNSEVQNIIINTLEQSKDSSIEKNMVWYAGKRFTIITKIQKANKPEKIKKLEVIWNDFSDQTNL
jgi:hypothetical protein